MIEVRRLTQAELVALATERFGENTLDWAFQCPNCGDVATGRDMDDALARFPRTRNGQPVHAADALGKECIGRVLGALRTDGYQGRGCNWCSFGLLPSPWTIEFPDGRTQSAFPLAEGATPV